MPSGSPCSAVASAAPLPAKLVPPLWCPGINRTDSLFHSMEVAYPFWERSGYILQDYSGNAAHLDTSTLAGAAVPPTWGTVGGFGLTDLGYSLVFSDINAVDLPVFESNKEFTVSFFFFTAFNNNTPMDSMVFFSDDGTNTIKVASASSGYQNFYVSNSGGSDQFCYLFETDKWHHVVIVNQQNTWLFYVNGVLIHTSNLTAGGNFVWKNVRLGSRGHDSPTADDQYLIGNVSLFIKWNRVVISSEVESLLSDPWRVFKMTNPLAFSSASSISITPTGGVVIGGSASVSVTPSGGVVVGGGTTPSFSYTFTPTGGVSVGSGGYSNGFKYRMLITVPAGKVTSNQTDFVLLVNVPVSSAHFGTSCRAETTGGTLLPSEFIGYSSGRLYAAVKKTLLTGSDNTFYLYYGEI